MHALLQGGQGIFGIAVGVVWRDVESALSQLHGERIDTGETLVGHNPAGRAGAAPQPGGLTAVPRRGRSGSTALSVPWCSIGDVRNAPTILHLDMDAFFASVEQASKPSLRGKAVVVGGLGPRGVVATASYEARAFGVHSAMPMAQARRLAPNAAYLVPRSRLYWAISEQVMALLRELSPLVEPLSLDEAFVDLEAGGAAWDEESARRAGEKLRADIRAVTGLTGSVGLAASKMLAKIASEQAKPDGLRLIEPGTERALLGPMPVRILPGGGAGHRGPSAPGRDQHGAGAGRGGRGRAGPAARQGARARAVRHGAGPRRAARGGRAGGQVGVGGGHVRRGHP